MAGELRKAIFDADDIESEIVDVPQWGVKVEVRGMSAKERASLLKSVSDDGGSVDLAKWFPDLVIAATFDPESGERVFEKADRDALNAKSGAAVQLLAETAARLSGLADNDVTTAKEGL